MTAAQLYTAIKRCTQRSVRMPGPLPVAENLSWSLGQGCPAAWRQGKSLAPHSSPGSPCPPASAAWPSPHCGQNNIYHSLYPMTPR